MQGSLVAKAVAVAISNYGCSKIRPVLACERLSCHAACMLRLCSLTTRLCCAVAQSDAEAVGYGSAYASAVAAVQPVEQCLAGQISQATATASAVATSSGGTGVLMRMALQLAYLALLRCVCHAASGLATATASASASSSEHLALLPAPALDTCSLAF